MALSWPAWDAVAAVPWSSNNFVYSAERKPLRELLSEFASAQGLSAVVDPEIKGLVNGGFNSVPDVFLARIASVYGLIWYYDGSVLHFNTASQARTKLVRLNDRRLSDLAATLRDLGIEDARFPLIYDGRTRSVRVSGPPRYVELVENAVALLNDGPVSRSAEGIRVFPLRYAWAQDQTIRTNDQSVTIPGVVTMLKRLFPSGNDSVPTQAPGPGLGEVKRLSSSGEPRGRDGGLGLERVYVPPSAGEAFAAYAERTAPRAGPKGTQLPQIEADVRMNAVIVRDATQLMSGYERLIQAIDVRPDVIEIEAHIIDMVAQDSSRLGVDWQYDRNRTSIGFDGGGTGGVSVNGPGLLDNTVVGVVASTVLRSGASELLARVSALAQEGRAQVLANPKVLTLGNVQATLSSTDTFYVRVSGNLSAELFGITAGTMLRVTPMAVVDDTGAVQIKMSIRAEDGAVTQLSVDQIPVVQRRSVDTEALIRVGESLLIGGLVYERDMKSLSAVPWLSKLPFIGALFRHKGESTVKTERMFLITPRLIDSKATTPPAKS